MKRVIFIPEVNSMKRITLGIIFILLYLLLYEYICMYVFIDIYLYMYIYTYPRTYTYIHVYYMPPGNLEIAFTMSLFYTGIVYKKNLSVIFLFEYFFLSRIFKFRKTLVAERNSFCVIFKEYQEGGLSFPAIANDCKRDRAKIPLF